MGSLRLPRGLYLHDVDLTVELAQVSCGPVPNPRHGTSTSSREGQATPPASWIRRPMGGAPGPQRAWEVGRCGLVEAPIFWGENRDAPSSQLPSEESAFRVPPSPSQLASENNCDQ